MSEKHWCSISFRVTLTSLTVLIAATLLFTWLFQPTVQKASELSQIAIGFSAIIATIAFVYQRDKDKTGFAIKQIGFFRQNVIIKEDALNNFLVSVEKAYLIPYPARIHVFTFAAYQTQFAGNLAQMNSLEVDLRSEGRQSKYQALEGELLNALEEFSAGVIYTDVSTHPALISVRQAYIEIVERRAYKILLMAQNEKFMHATVVLYDRWKDKIVRK